MWRFKLLSPLVLTGLVCLMTCMNAFADEYVEIVTPVPAPREVIVMPKGYSNCITVVAGWFKGVWYPEHRVCQYDPQKVQHAEGDAYVEGHWACTKYLTEAQTKGECTNWDWKPAHWVKTFSEYLY